MHYVKYILLYLQVTRKLTNQLFIPIGMEAIYIGMYQAIRVHFSQELVSNLITYMKWFGGKKLTLSQMRQG